MKMIIGGAYQGKTEYAKIRYSLNDCDIIDGKNINSDKISNIACIKNFHLFIKNILENGEKPIDIVKKILHENPEIIIISDEIGNGIIPIEKSDRIWREEVGRTCCYLVKEAEIVIRIIGGLPVILKEKKS